MIYVEEPLIKSGFFKILIERGVLVCTEQNREGALGACTARLSPVERSSPIAPYVTARSRRTRYQFAKANNVNRCAAFFANPRYRTRR